MTEESRLYTRLYGLTVIELAKKSETHGRCWATAVEPCLAKVIDAVQQWEYSQLESTLAPARQEMLWMDTFPTTNVLEFMHKLGLATNMAHLASAEDRYNLFSELHETRTTSGVVEPSSRSDELFDVSAPRTVLDIGTGGLSRGIACVCANHVNQYQTFVPAVYGSAQEVIAAQLEFLRQEKEISHVKYPELPPAIMQQMFSVCIENISEKLQILQMTNEDVEIFMPDADIVHITNLSISVWRYVRQYILHRIGTSPKHRKLFRPTIMIINNVGDAFDYLETIKTLHVHRNPLLTDMSSSGPVDPVLRHMSLDDIVDFQWVDRESSLAFKDALREVAFHARNAQEYAGKATLHDIGLKELLNGSLYVFDEHVQSIVFCYPPNKSELAPFVQLPQSSFHETRPVASDTSHPFSLESAKVQEWVDTLVAVVPNRRLQVKVGDGDYQSFDVPAFVYACEAVGEDQPRSIVDTWAAHTSKDPETRHKHWFVRGVLPQIKRSAIAAAATPLEKVLGPAYTYEDYLAVHYRPGAHTQNARPDVISCNASILAPEVWRQVESRLREWTRGAHNRFAVWVNSGMEQATAYFSAMASNAVLAKYTEKDQKHHLMSHVAMLPSFKNLAEQEMYKRDMHLINPWLSSNLEDNNRQLIMPACLPVHACVSVHSTPLEKYIRLLLEMACSPDRIAGETGNLQAHMQRVIEDAILYRKCESAKDSTDDLRLIVINNDVPEFQKTFANMALKAIQHTLETHRKEGQRSVLNVDSPVGLRVRSKAQRKKDLREPWVCFTHDPLDEQHASIYVGNVVWYRHFTIPLSPDMYIYNATKSKTGTLALYRRSLPESLDDMDTSLAQNARMLDTTAELVHVMDEYSTRLRTAEMVCSQTIQNMLSQTSTRDDAPLLMPFLPVDTTDMDGSSLSGSASREYQPHLSSGQIASVPSSMDFENSSVVRTDAVRVPVFARSSFGSRELDKCMALRDDITARLIPNTDAAFFQLLSARLAGMLNNEGEAAILERLKQRREAQSQRNKKDLESYFGATNKPGEIRDVFLYPLDPVGSPAVPTRLPVPVEKLFSPSVLVASEESVPNLNFAPEVEVRLSVTLVPKLAKQGPDELVLYGNCIYGYTSLLMAVFYQTARDVFLKYIATAPPEKSGSAAIIHRLLGGDAGLVKTRDAHMEYYIESRKSMEKLESIRLGARSRQWLEQIVERTNAAMQEPTKMYQLKLDMLRHFKTMALEDADTVAKLTQEADRYFVTKVLQPANAILDGIRKLKPHVHIDYMNAVDAFERFANHSDIRSNSLFVAMRESIQRGCRSLKTAYLLRRLCLVHHANRYMEQMQADRALQELGAQINMAQRSDALQSEVVSTLMKVRVSDFLAINAQKTAESVLANSRTGLTHGHDKRLLLESPNPVSGMSGSAKDLAWFQTISGDLAGSDDGERIRMLMDQLFMVSTDKPQNAGLDRIYRLAMLSMWVSTDSMQTLSSRQTAIHQGKTTKTDHVHVDGDARVQYQSEFALRANQFHQLIIEKQMPEPLFALMADRLQTKPELHFVPMPGEKYSKEVITNLMLTAESVIAQLAAGRTRSALSLSEQYDNFVRWAVTRKPDSRFYSIGYEVVENLDAQKPIPNVSSSLYMLVKLRDLFDIPHGDAKGRASPAKEVHKAMASYCFAYMRSNRVWNALNQRTGGSAFAAIIEFARQFAEIAGTASESYIMFSEIFRISKSKKTEPLWAFRAREYLMSGDLTSDDDVESSINTFREETDIYFSRHLKYLTHDIDAFDLRDHSKYARMIEAQILSITRVCDLAICTMLRYATAACAVGFALWKSPPALTFRNAAQADFFDHATLRNEWQYAVSQLGSAGGVRAGRMLHAYDKRVNAPIITYREGMDPEDEMKVRPNPSLYVLKQDREYIELCRVARAVLAIDSIGDLLRLACVSSAFSGESNRSSEKRAECENFWSSIDPARYAPERSQNAVRTSQWDRVGPLRYGEYISWGLVLVQSIWNVLFWAMSQTEDGSFVDDRTVINMPLMVVGVKTPGARFTIFPQPPAERRYRQWPSVVEFVQETARQHALAIKDNIFPSAMMQWSRAAPKDRWGSISVVLGSLLVCTTTDCGLRFREITHSSENAENRFMHLLASEKRVPDLVETYRIIAKIVELKDDLDSSDESDYEETDALYAEDKRTESDLLTTDVYNNHPSIADEYANEKAGLTILSLAFPGTSVLALHMHKKGTPFNKMVFAPPGLPATTSDENMLDIQQAVNAMQIDDPAPTSAEVVIAEENSLMDTSPSVGMMQELLRTPRSSGNLRNRLLAASQGTLLTPVDPETGTIDIGRALQQIDLHGGTPLQAMQAIQSSLQEEMWNIYGTMNILNGDMTLVPSVLRSELDEEDDADFLMPTKIVSPDSDDTRSQLPDARVIIDLTTDVDASDPAQLIACLEDSIATEIVRKTKITKLTERAERLKRRNLGRTIPSADAF